MRGWPRSMGLRCRLLLALGLLATVSWPQPVQAQESRVRDAYFWASGQVHSAVLSDIVDGSSAGLAFGVAGTFGRRWPNSGLGLFVQVDNTWWNEPILSPDNREVVFHNETQTSINLGLGAEYLFWEDRVRLSVTVGPTILLLDTALDTPGTVGLWFDVRPAGIRVPLAADLWFAIDPVTLTVLLPDLSGIPLVLIHYRTSLALEFILR